MMCITKCTVEFINWKSYLELLLWFSPIQTLEKIVIDLYIFVITQKLNFFVIYLTSDCPRYTIENNVINIFVTDK